VDCNQIQVKEAAGRNSQEAGCPNEVLLVPVLGDVMLAGFFGMMLGVDRVTLRGVRMVTGLFMIAGAMMLGCMAMMLGGVLVVLGGFQMMLRGVF
jgi:hypothetical protein